MTKNSIIDFSSISSKANNTNQDRPKAQFWANLGYTVKVNVQTDAGTEQQERFISLPIGIALDGQEALPINSTNVDYANMNAARNALYEKVMAACEKLAPGESSIVNLDVQIRRVKADVQTAVDASENPFIAGFDIAAVG